MKKLRLGRHHRTAELRDVIKYELTGSGCYLGCRALTKRLLSKYDIRSSRQKVLALQRELDPDGVALRRSHGISRRCYRNPGPNHSVHIDGYDKLKQFGFPIHAGVDGRVLWLKTGPSNNDPVVVARYFIEYLQEMQGAPVIVRVDAGTENVDIQDIQITFREEHTDEHRGDKSVIVGSSHSNQRVERWWSSLRGHGGGFWIDMFKDLVDEGIFSTSDQAHIECVRFCFKQILQRELDQIRMDWNQHRIRSCKLSGFQGGKPDLLYFTPELYDSSDRKLPVLDSDITAVKQMYDDLQPVDDNNEFYILCLELLRANGRPFPQDCTEAADLLKWLINELNL